MEKVSVSKELLIRVLTQAYHDSRGIESEMACCKEDHEGFEEGRKELYDLLNLLQVNVK